MIQIKNILSRTHVCQSPSPYHQELLFHTNQFQSSFSRPSAVRGVQKSPGADGNGRSKFSQLIGYHRLSAHDGKAGSAVKPDTHTIHGGFRSSAHAENSDDGAGSGGIRHTRLGKRQTNCCRVQYPVPFSVNLCSMQPPSIN